jgi:formate dehydrogenase subunit gamma
MRMRELLAVVLSVFLVLSWPAASQEATSTEEDPREATGGAQTLEDILARQRGENVDYDFRRNATGDPNSAAGLASQLGTLGGTSDSEVFRALRYGTADVTSSSRGPGAGVLIQDGGMWWLNFRSGPLIKYGLWTLGGMIVLLALFLLLRGRIRIDGEKTGRTIQRFDAFERFSHWLLAISFIILGLTGIVTLIGRKYLIPFIGHDAYADLAGISKWAHNNISWAFMIALVLIFLLWVRHNIPNKHDLVWLSKAGGLFSKGVHPPAKKFNAGQKVIFWSVIIFGASIAISGLSLLFPFELPMFAKTFAIMNDLGLPQMFGYGTLPEQLAPHEEMQYAQLWHAIVAFLLMAIIIAHIYLGSVGMEGAYDAMGSGMVEEQWAKEHHSLWVEDVKAKEAASSDAARAPAE